MCYEDIYIIKNKNKKVTYICKGCKREFKNKQNIIAHSKFCIDLIGETQYKENIENYKLKSRKHRIFATIDNYKEKTLELLKEYKNKYKKPFPKKYLDLYIIKQLDRTQKGLPLSTPISWLKCVLYNKSKEGRAKSKIMGKKNNHFRVEGQVKYFKEHPEEKKKFCSAAGKIGGKVTQQKHPDCWKKMNAAGIQYWKDHPEERKLLLDKMNAKLNENDFAIRKQNCKKMAAKNKENNYFYQSLGGIICSILHPEVAKAWNKGGLKYLKEHPEIRTEIGKKNIHYAINKMNELILSGEWFSNSGSKEETLCREELEKELNIEFDYKLDNKNKKQYSIWIQNPDKTTINKEVGICKCHPYDFGIKNFKLLIEYDGCFYHKFTKIRDNYWTKVAKDKGYTLFRIDSRDWKSKKKKQKIILNIKKFIEGVKK